MPLYSSPSVPKELESAFFYGYSVFTTFIVVNNAVKGLSLHLDRLQSNAKELFRVDIEKKEILDVLKSFVSHQSLKQPSIIRITICPKSFSLVFPEKIDDISIVITHRPIERNITKKIKLQLFPMTRPFAHCKTSFLFPYLSARALAHTHGYDDALLYDQNGNITEGPTWNIFFQHGNTLVFPKNNTQAFLNGITQQLLQLHFCNTFHIVFEDISIQDIQKYSSAYMCSAGMGVQPIEAIENIRFFNYQSVFSDWYEKILEPEPLL